MRGLVGTSCLGCEADDDKWLRSQLGETERPHEIMRPEARPRMMQSRLSWRAPWMTKLTSLVGGTFKRLPGHIAKGRRMPERQARATTRWHDKNAEDTSYRKRRRPLKARSASSANVCFISPRRPPLRMHVRRKIHMTLSHTNNPLKGGRQTPKQWPPPDVELKPQAPA